MTQELARELSDPRSMMGSMLLSDLFDPAALAHCLAEGYVRQQTHPTLPLAILNYSEKTAYESYWTPVTMACRGLIYDLSTMEVIARPYEKFMNHGQAGAPDIALDAPVTVTDKVDGSLAITYPTPDGWAIATRGSFASEQAIHATEVLRTRYPHFIPPAGTTILLEIIYPANRIVCLEGDTAVNVWGGGTTTMRKIVDHGADPLLVGMDRDGKLVPTRITERLNNGRRDDWHAVTVTSAMHRGRNSTSNSVIRMTGDHRVLADGEWVKAAELQPGQKLVSSIERPSESILHLVRASMLGDGCLSPGTRAAEAWFSEGHTTRRGDGSYGKVLHGWLGPCATKLTGPDGFDLVQTSRFEAFGDIRREWYSSGFKCVPGDLSWLDDFAVAKWYMDDGCLASPTFGREAVHFATNGFTYPDVERLGIELNERYGVTCHIVKTPSGPLLNVSPGRRGRANCITRLWEAIAPHVHPSMRYKLPADYRTVPYREYPTGTRDLVVKVEEVVSVEELDSLRCSNAWSRTAYDIGTETGNFMARNTLVHNCDYGDMDDLVLLGSVDITTGQSYGPDRPVGWTGPSTEIFPYLSFAEALAAPPRDNREGLVVHDQKTDKRIKLKYAAYVELHKIVTGLNARTVWQHLVDGKPLAELIEPLPDEFRPWVENVAAQLAEGVELDVAVIENAHGEVVGQLAPGYSRKDFAMLAVSHPLRWALFLLEDGKDCRAELWQRAKPEAYWTPAGRRFGEDTA